MNKQELLANYPKQEDKLFVAKLLDKIEEVKTKNKIVTTDFLDLYQKSIAEKLVKGMYENFIFFGGSEGSERTILMLYPEKLEMEIAEKMYSNIMSIIRITLPQDLQGKYQHKTYLGAVMKFGLKREKVGDIAVRIDGADIIVQKEIAQYLKQSLEELTRFGKAQIEILELEELQETETKKELIQIMVPSLRMDNIVSDLLKLSRNKVNEVIAAGRVFINSENILKNSKMLKEKDVIVIRGKGKFEFESIDGKTKKEKYILNILKYI